MSDTLKRIIETLGNSRFCYDLEGGQGFAPKEHCTCTTENPCQAKQDADRFHAYFKECEYGDGKRRNEIVQQIKPEFEDSFWWKHNVTE